MYRPDYRSAGQRLLFCWYRSSAKNRSRYTASLARKQPYRSIADRDGSASLDKIFQFLSRAPRDADYPAVSSVVKLVQQA